MALMKQLGYDHTMDSLAANVRRVKTCEGEVFVAEVNGKVVGVISAIMDVRLAEGVSGEIVSLVVSDQIKGVKALFAFVVRFLLISAKIVLPKQTIQGRDDATETKILLTWSTCPYSTARSLT
ncbi:hypothetical protein [Amphritea pacifica]|uniref:CBS domain-containing protein n=1 Tax=Amphritea pacifica TaxID=2811233 RepID=A0ABS2W528_9GAMM|nr:hypothetical protein [Amphritea pacifica]MBN0986691.1 hypothetical protein [Amphritea pacifica]